MEEAAKAHVPYYVFDRPNPITGIHVEGPVLIARNESFIGYFPLPVRHGMTIGELARMFKVENAIHADLTVVPMLGWQRTEWFDATGLPWINPSPNIRNLNEAILYPGSRCWKLGELFGWDAERIRLLKWWAPSLSMAWRWLRYLIVGLIPGVRAYPVRFKPTRIASGGKDASKASVWWSPIAMFSMPGGLGSNWLPRYSTCIRERSRLG